MIPQRHVGLHYIPSLTEATQTHYELTKSVEKKITQYLGFFLIICYHNGIIIWNVNIG